MALDPFTAGFDLVKTGLDKFFPDADTELKGKLAEAASQINNDFQLQLAQLDINKTEAASSSLFVSGWRPAIGWICGAAFSIQFVFGPLAVWGSRLYGHPVDFPAMDMGEMMPVLLGMLGLSGLRTFEKVKSVA